MHTDELVEEHCVHCPASGPDVLQAGNAGLEHMKGTMLFDE